ncbi:MAG TPA: hypothetical protein VMP01_11475 [Pirellulaceae bacterium]|nr:hypothetical protein [Pirellulaceae bacterium]
MTISQDIKHELDRIQALQGPARLVVDAPAGSLESQLATVDAIGCALESLAYRTDKLAGATIAQLKKLSGDLTKRLTYLLEPIGALEADAESCTVQMRSSPPQQGEDGSSYYELLVRRGGEISLCRYAKSPGQVRRTIPAQVTREVFTRLAEDFVAAVG